MVLSGQLGLLGGFFGSGLHGLVCWARFAGVGFLKDVCLVGFALLGLLDHVCWVKFADLSFLSWRFAGAGFCLGEGGLLEGVCGSLLGGTYLGWLGRSGLLDQVCLVIFTFLWFTWSCLQGNDLDMIR